VLPLYLPTNPFELLHKIRNLLKNSLLLCSELRVQWTHLRKRGIESSAIFGCVLTLQRRFDVASCFFLIQRFRFDQLLGFTLLFRLSKSEEGIDFSPSFWRRNQSRVSL